MRLEALLFAACPLEAFLFVRPPASSNHRFPLPTTTSSILRPDAIILKNFVDDDDYPSEQAWTYHHELYWLHGQSNDDDDDLLWLGDTVDGDGGDDNENQNSLGESVGQGKVVLCLPDIATDEECETLFQAAAAQSTTSQVGRSRYSVADPNIFDANIVFTTEEILLRVLDYLDDNVPSIYSWLFDPSQKDWTSRQPWNAALEQPSVPPDPMLAETCTTLRELYMQGALEWSEGEPAINIYKGGGYFGAHKDHLALTILIPLTSIDSFQG